MEYRVLGKTGLRVSAIGIGTWQLCGPMDFDGKADGFPDPGRERVIGLIRGCGDLGINVIDTAESYGDGEGERRVGEAIRGDRDRWVLITKFGLRRGKNGERIQDPSAPTIRKSLEGSLRRLSTDRVDVLLFHVPPAARDTAASVATLEDLRVEGKLRYWGCSTNDVIEIGDLAALGPIGVVLIAQSMLTEPRRTLSLARKHGLGVLVRGVFEGGRLTGKYARGATFPESDIRRRTLSGEDFARFTAYERLLPDGWGMVELALRYVLDFDTTHTVVLGARSLADYERAAAAVELPRLSERVVEEIGALRRALAPRRVTLRQMARALARRVRRLRLLGASRARPRQ